MLSSSLLSAVLMVLYKHPSHNRGNDFHAFAEEFETKQVAITLCSSRGLNEVAASTCCRYGVLGLQDLAAGCRVHKLVTNLAPDQGRQVPQKRKKLYA